MLSLTNQQQEWSHSIEDKTYITLRFLKLIGSLEMILSLQYIFGFPTMVTLTFTYIGNLSIRCITKIW